MMSIHLAILIRGERMVNCTKKQIRELKTALRWKILEAQRQRIQMLAARERYDPAYPCGSDGATDDTLNRAHDL